MSLETMEESVKQHLLNQLWHAMKKSDETDDEFYERLRDASWKGLTGQRYVVDQRSASGMGPMPDWLKEEGDEKFWMKPEAVWGAWCNVCLDGVVGLYDVVQYWYIHHYQDHQARPENDWATAYEKAEWELRTTGHVTHATVDGLMKRIERLEHRLRGAEIGSLLKETSDGQEREEADAGDDAGDDGRSGVG